MKYLVWTGIRLQKKKDNDDADEDEEEEDLTYDPGWQSDPG